MIAVFDNWHLGGWKQIGAAAALTSEEFLAVRVGAATRQELETRRDDLRKAMVRGWSRDWRMDDYAIIELHVVLSEMHVLRKHVGADVELDSLMQRGDIILELRQALIVADWARFESTVQKYR